MVNFLFWINQLLIAFDQFLNALLFGWADETLSARAWRTRLKPLPRIFVPVINTIFFWQKNHCKESFESEQQMKQLPVAYRTKTKE